MAGATNGFVGSALRRKLEEPPRKRTVLDAWDAYSLLLVGIPFRNRLLTFRALGVAPKAFRRYSRWTKPLPTKNWMDMEGWGMGFYSFLGRAVVGDDPLVRLVGGVALL